MIVQFWAKVYGRLQAVHGLTAADAATAILRHRADEYLVEDMEYHSNWYDVADLIALGWRNGALRPPTPAAPGADTSFSATVGGKIGRRATTP